MHAPGPGLEGSREQEAVASLAGVACAPPPVTASTSSHPRAAQLLPALLPVAVSLAVWPGGPTPFSTAKGGVLAAGALLALASALAWPRPASAPARLLGWAWAGTLAASALGGEPLPSRLALEASAALLLVALLQRTPSPGAVLRGATWAGTAVAAVALLQWLGADPFRLVGLAPDLQTPRLRVYATLGNPDFVAGLLGACLVATLARARAGWTWAAAGLQLLALAACQSFASVLALAAAGLAAGVHAARHGGRPRRALLGAAALALLALGALGLGLRGRGAVGEAAGGRRYLWAVAAPHVRDAPWVGAGPGSVTLRWPGWEALHWQGAAAQGAERRYAGAQDHVHCDPLEWLLDLGLLGTLPRLGLAALALGAALRRGGREGLGLAATQASLLARAAVDFPLARPAELLLWLLACAAAFSPRRTP
ncbi:MULTISPECIES: hypothetical protein [Myxococcaceae]|uniref:hypothetical protein n=1 Tax=Myxococcaceae TaxID=31 RepID=UPI00129C64B2|nr:MULTISPECIES: hypothetical protein [Myxococcaceae]MBF5043122.1 hypothetical protein [Simulacricoccus sp. 17bor-14]